MEIKCPVVETIWGPITTKADFVALIRMQGQFFGVDQSGPACNYNASYPCDQSLYQYMGWGTHKGIDIPVATGTKIYAAADGKCVRLSDSTTQGLGVILRHQNINLETVYWHNQSNSVALGQEVKAGDLIAISDSTGFSSGPHLHFETRNIDDIGNFVSYADPITLISFEEDMKFELKQVPGSPEVWLIRNGKKTHVYDPDALLLVADFSDIQSITSDALDALPESGFELTALVKR